MNRHLSFLDRTIVQADRALRTLSANTQPHFHQSPANQLDEAEISSDGSSNDKLIESEKRLSANLMRVNHTGEVCAQALYQGQAATAKLEDTRQEMEIAADEEIDHLAWCEERLKELDSRPSLLNPLFYGLSFGLGATAGLISDRVSLGFVAATEDQVCKHLQDHLQRLPEQDIKSRAVVTQMLNDEADHASKARQAGAAEFPFPVKAGMSLVSKAMTWSTFRI